MGLDDVPHPARLEVLGLRLLPGTSTPGQPQASTLLGVEAAEDALVDSELHRPLQASRTSGAAATNLFRLHDIGRARRERKEDPRVHPDAGGVVTPSFASPHRATLAHPVEALLGADPIAEEPNVQVKLLLGGPHRLRPTALPQRPQSTARATCPHPNQSQATADRPQRPHGI